MAGRPMHEGQLQLDEQDARVLVLRRFPGWADRPVRAVPSDGTVNALFRVGADVVVRFPLQPAPLAEVRADLEAERDAATRLATMTSVPVPVPLAVVADREPAWAAYRWLPGTPATAVSPGEALARDLAAFIRDLRAADTGGRTFTGSWRGGRLADHDGDIRESLERARHLIDVDPLLGLWTRLRDTPRTEPDRWAHRDLMPGNLLVRDGRLAGVLDVGTLAPADPAIDLQPAWNTFDAGTRVVFGAAVGAGEAEWQRGRAWALAQAAGCLAYYEHTNPAMSRLAHRTLTAVLAG